MELAGIEMADLTKMKQDEWLEADGLGGFASGTAAVQILRHRSIEPADAYIVQQRESLAGAVPRLALGSSARS
jgi:hypothetical protein